MRARNYKTRIREEKYGSCRQSAVIATIVNVNDKVVCQKRLEYVTEIYISKSARTYVLFCESRTIPRAYSHLLPRLYVTHFLFHLFRSLIPARRSESCLLRTDASSFNSARTFCLLLPWVIIQSSYCFMQSKKLAPIFIIYSFFMTVV